MFQNVPLYEFLRLEAGAKKPFVMPVPFFNVLNGGVHSGNRMAFQETMIAPVGASSTTEAVRMGSEVYQHLKKVVTSKFGASGKCLSCRVQRNVLRVLIKLSGSVMRAALRRPSQNHTKRLTS